MSLTGEVINAGASEASQDASQIINDGLKKLRTGIQKLRKAEETIIKSTSVADQLVRISNLENIQARKVEGIETRQAYGLAYEAIQEIRAAFVGVDLKYHLYATIVDNETSSIDAIEVSQADIGKYFTYGSSTGINVSIPKEFDKNLDRLKHMEIRQKLLELVMERTRKRKNGRNTRYRILKEGTATVWKKKERSKTALTSYTLGHFSEAIDGAISEALLNEKDLSSLSDEELLHYFYNHLRSDSVSGFYGGDNSYENVQVKANQASLMRYSTIHKAIIEVEKIILEIEQKKSSMTDLIKGAFFSSKSDSVDLKVDERINKIAEKILSEGLGI